MRATKSPTEMLGFVRASNDVRQSLCSDRSPKSFAVHASSKTVAIDRTVPGSDRTTDTRSSGTTDSGSDLLITVRDDTGVDDELHESCFILSLRREDFAREDRSGCQVGTKIKK